MLKSLGQKLGEEEHLNSASGRADADNVAIRYGGALSRVLIALDTNASPRNKFR